MQNHFKSLLSFTAIAGCFLLGSIHPEAQADSAASSVKSVIDEGKGLAFDRKKGNCLACHVMGDGQLPGNIGPPIVAMKARYSDKAKLREQIYDARISNPHTIMIPFGPHGVLSNKEVDKITEYVYTL
ncbi:MAG: sulfur oxidation c-type cytochrome SoxX [Pseudomonadota bacterium]